MASFIEPKKISDTIDTSALSWKTSKKSVVSITKKGVAVAQKAGSVTITATSGKKKATIKLVVKKNKLDNINAKPKLGSIKYRDYDIVLKSLEITNPSTVVAEYYLVFNYPTSYKTTKFTVIEDEITAYDAYYEEYMTIVDGSARDIKVSAKGQQVKVFKVTYKGSSVWHTDIALKDSKGTVSDDWYAYLNWKY